MICFDLFSFHQFSDTKLWMVALFKDCSNLSRFFWYSSTKASLFSSAILVTLSKSLSLDFGILLPVGYWNVVESFLWNQSRPSVRPPLSFLKFGSLVFSDIVHDDSWPWYLVNDSLQQCLTSSEDKIHVKSFLGPYLGQRC